jgi:IPT/TIG domain
MPPVISEMGPHTGKEGEVITIEGDNFDHGCEVVFGTVRVTHPVFYGGAPRRLLVHVPPPAHEFTVTIRVINRDESSSAPNPPHDRFAYETTNLHGKHVITRYRYGGAGAQVTSLTNAYGPTVGGNTVVIDGTNLPNMAAGPAVYFGTAAGTGVAYTAAAGANPAYLTAVAPAQAAGPVSVRVTDAAHTPPEANPPWDTYTYANQPTVTMLSVATGSTAGNTSVTITGTNFTNVASVLFGGNNAAGFSVTNATTIVALSPPGAAGTVDVRVANPAGTSVINQPNDQFTYS